MHTGSATVPMPSLGAWLSYGLGTLNANLPVLRRAVRAHAVRRRAGLGQQLPAAAPPGRAHRPRRRADPRPALAGAAPRRCTSWKQVMLRDVNERHAGARPERPEPAGADRTASRRPRGMMRESPRGLRPVEETEATLAAVRGRRAATARRSPAQCLIARRLVERGVRVVELIDTGSNNNWDAHGDMQDHRPKAQRVDQPLAAPDPGPEAARPAGRDARGHLHRVRPHPVDRHPQHQGPQPLRQGVLVPAGRRRRQGRDRPTARPTSTASTSSKDPCHVHDYHATILHLMGIDHTRLTYRYAGRDFRLTDVHGRVLREILV